MAASSARIRRAPPVTLTAARQSRNCTGFPDSTWEYDWPQEPIALTAATRFATGGACAETAVGASIMTIAQWRQGRLAPYAKFHLGGALADCQLQGMMAAVTRDPSTRGPSAAVREVVVGSLTFRVTDTGPPHARPVLLLHGFPQTSWCWRHVVPALATAGHRVLTLDQRGYSPGACPEAVDDYAGEHLVSDVTGMLDALGIESVDLVGHDWGAAVAWQVAGYHPERVTTLTAISVPHPGAFMEALASDPDQQARSAYMADFATPGYERVLLADDAAGLRSLLGDETAVDVDHVLSRLGTETQLRRPLNWYAAQSAARALATPHTAVPTLHIWSDGDPALGAYGARATHRYVTGPYRLITLRDVGHWIPEAAPQQVADLVVTHVAQN